MSMVKLSESSKMVELPYIPEGPGIALILNSQCEVLQITASKNIRRRIGTQPLTWKNLQSALDAKCPGASEYVEKVTRQQ